MKEVTEDYDKFEKVLNKILEETIGSTNIRIGKKKKIYTSAEGKQLKAEMKTLRKEFARAIKENSGRKKDAI